MVYTVVLILKCKSFPLTCVCPFVYLEILRSGEHLSTTRKRARERLLARVHSDVVHQLVFGFERSSIPGASLPTTSMSRTLRSADMFHSQMGHNLMHAPKVLPALFPRHRLLRLHPLALHLLLHRLLSHIPEECPMPGVMMRHYMMRHGELVMMRRRLVMGIMMLASPHHLVMVEMRIGQRLVVVQCLVVQSRREYDVAGRSLGHEVVSPQQEVSGGIPGVVVQMGMMVGVGLLQRMRMMSMGVVMVATRGRRHLDSVRGKMAVGCLHEGVHHELVTRRWHVVVAISTVIL